MLFNELLFPKSGVSTKWSDNAVRVMSTEGSETVATP